MEEDAEFYERSLIEPAARDQIKNEDSMIDQKSGDDEQEIPNFSESSDL